MYRSLGLILPLAVVLVGCSSKDATAESNAVVEEPVAMAEAAAAPELCLDAGPQTPRDISSALGLNTVTFDTAPPAQELNLCNIHTHTNAEHKAPGFSVFVNDTDSGGYACNGTDDLTAAELEPLEGAYGGVKPGDTIEVHWVHSSCDVSPGPGLGSCLTDACTNPQFRVEAQTFLVVNDRNAANFMDYSYSGTMRNGLHQAMAIPSGTGDPVEFLGSTTGPSFNQSTCSPFQVTWNVRPMCKKVDIASLHAWAESGNVFEETKSHGVRQLVTAPELLSPIE